MLINIEFRLQLLIESGVVVTIPERQFVIILAIFQSKELNYIFFSGKGDQRVEQTVEMVHEEIEPVEVTVVTVEVLVPLARVNLTCSLPDDQDPRDRVELDVLFLKYSVACLG